MPPSQPQLSCVVSAGISRSPTLVLAYLMVDEGLSLEAAFAEVGTGYQHHLI